MTAYYFKGEMNPGTPSPNTEVIKAATSPVIEYVPKFAHIQEDLLFLFNVNVTSESTLNYEFVKDELYTKVIEELKLGTPFALDYMFEEEIHGKKLLSREDLQERGIQEMKPYAKTILANYKKGPRLLRAKNLFVDTGVLTEEETDSVFAAS